MTALFTLFILSRASGNTRPTSQNIGGMYAWAVPRLKFWGDRPLSPPRSPTLNESQQTVNLQRNYTVSGLVDAKDCIRWFSAMFAYSIYMLKMK